MKLSKKNVELIFMIVILFVSGIYAQGKWNVQNPLPSESYMLTIEPVTDNIVYVGGFGGTLLKSCNNGASWTVQKFEELINIRSICFRNSLNGWILDGEHIYNTINGGESWNEVNVNTDITTYYFLDITCFENTIYLFLKPRTAYISDLINANSLVLKSTDGGETWIQLEILIKGKILCSYFLNERIGYIYAQEYVSINESFNSFYKTNNGGLTWVKSKFPVQQFTAGIHFINEIKGFIGKYKTTDGGKTWENMLNNYEVNDIFFKDSLNGFAVSGVNILQTEDGGNTWVKLDVTGNKNLADIKFSKNGTGWIVGWAGDILQKMPYEKKWKNLSKGARHDLKDVFFIDENNGWSVGVKGCILHTSNGGETWEEQNSNTDRPLLKVKFLNKLEGWIVGYKVVLSTKDGGDNWQTISGLHRWFVDIDFFDDTNGLIIENYGFVYKTTDRGITWELINDTPISKRLTSVTIVNENEAWIGGAGGLGHTIDKGTTIQWKEVPLLSLSLVKDVQFVSNNVGFLCNDNGDFFGTDDGGRTWFEYPREKELFAMINTFFAHDTNIVWIYLGLGSGYLKQITANQTLEVTDIHEYCIHPIRAIFFINSTTGWAVGDGGAILKYTDNSSQLPELQKKPELKKKQVYIHPNPFDETGTNISFLLQYSQNVNIQIYNIVGQKVKTLYNGLLSKGINKLFWKPNNVAAGPYVIFIQCNEFNQAQKCIFN